MLAMQVLIKRNLAGGERSLPFQLANFFFKILSTKGFISSLLKFSKCRGTPKYLIGKEPIGQQNICEIL